ncbi:hypothetical protein SVAN01_04944 [Stagonosporopsis vannaccii]|nr:hypothetical protein SVAN01_04944 [Stagonosporopsis vannaccii]
MHDRVCRLKASEYKSPIGSHAAAWGRVQRWKSGYAAYSARESTLAWANTIWKQQTTHAVDVLPTPDAASGSKLSHCCLLPDLVPSVYIHQHLGRGTPPPTMSATPPTTMYAWLPSMSTFLNALKVAPDLAAFVYCCLFMPHPFLSFVIYGIARYRTDLPASFLSHTHNKMAITADPPLDLGTESARTQPAKLGSGPGAEGLDMLPSIAEYISKIITHRICATTYSSLLPRQLRIALFAFALGVRGPHAMSIVVKAVDGGKKRRALAEAVPSRSRKKRRITAVAKSAQAVRVQQPSSGKKCLEQDLADGHGHGRGDKAEHLGDEVHRHGDETDQLVKLSSVEELIEFIAGWNSSLPELYWMGTSRDGPCRSMGAWPREKECSSFQASVLAISKRRSNWCTRHAYENEPLLEHGHEYSQGHLRARTGRLVAEQDPRTEGHERKPQRGFSTSQYANVI